MRATRVLLLALLAALGAFAPAADGAETLPAGFELEVLAEGMGGTDDVVWAPDGRMFVSTTTNGLINIVNPGSRTPNAKIDLPGAIYGIALDPQFAANGFLYVVRTENAQRSQRLTRIQVSPQNKMVGTEKVLVGALTSCKSPPVEEDCMSALGAHDTGQIRTDPRDNTIWFGNGDNNDPGYRPLEVLAGVQGETTLTGKIMHVDRDGNGLPGHPFCPGVTDLTRPCTKIFAKGFRNPYRFSWLPSGDLLVGDVGWNSREELSILRTSAGGQNFGWPCYEGSLHTPSYRDDPNCQPLYALEGQPGGVVQPAWEYEHIGNNFAIIAGPTYTGGTYPAEFVGDSFVADYGQGTIKRVRLGPDGTLLGVADFASGLHDPTDLELAPNGDLVFVELRGRVVAIRSSGANHVPVAAAKATPASGDPPLKVTFSSAGSSDADGDKLAFDWDFGDGSPHATTANATHTYATRGTFTARLTVTDARGAGAVATVTVNVGNSAPSVQLTAPALYRDGQAVSVTGAATDAEDGVIAPDRFHWTSVLVHNQHVHVGDEQEGGKSFTFVAGTDHDADSFYRVTLTVGDSDGGETASTVELRPETTDLALTSSPPGAPLVYDGVDVVAPLFKPAAVGLQTTVSAAPTFTSGGATYRFDHWSDGGARLHDITIPAAPVALEATYVPDRGEVAGTVAGTPPPPPAQPPPATGAAAPTRVEAEAMAGVSRRGPARAVRERGAGGGRVALLRAPATLRATVDAPVAARLTVTARGRACGGAPTMTVLLDGDAVVRMKVPAGRLGPTSVPLGLAPGRHALAVRYSGDAERRPCDRALVVDRLVLSDPAAVPVPSARRLAARVQAERMRGAGASDAARLTDPAASGGAAVRLRRGGALSVRQAGRGAIRTVALDAHGERCAGDAALVLRRDGAEKLRVSLPPGALQPVVATLGLARGPARLALTPAGAGRDGSCERALVVDRLSLYR